MPSAAHADPPHERAIPAPATPSELPTPSGLWAPIVATPTTAALMVDFDGSIAPIVDDPASARPLPEAVDALSRLARRCALVAVVTGRPVAHVRAHLADPAVVIVGQYGLERDRDGVVVVDPRAESFGPVVAAAADAAERAWPGLVVERKGGIAFTLHWRTAPEHAPTEADLGAFAAHHGLERLPGRMACELRPPVDVGKGTAVTDLLGSTECTAAAFAGDDHGDRAAFAALAAWARERPGERTALRVAVASGESPPELLAEADLVLDGPDALGTQLTALAAALDQRAAAS